MMKALLSALGLTAVLVLFVSAAGRREGPFASAARQSPPGMMEIRGDGFLRMLAVGDINLGRQVGQEILRGDTLFPFASVAETLLTFDIVFGNLECTLSDQGGETQHPRNNLIFTGPPAGAWSLRRGGVTVVSTANNHALDYGFRAHRQTIRALEEAAVQYAGTASDSVALYRPAIVERNGIRIAFFAVTDVMNIEDPVWRRYVAAADTLRLLPGIRSCRDSADFLVVSYHGGGEYADKPTRETERFARAVLDAGADLFLGHHPHVPQRIDIHRGKYIVYSLGNFVFRQEDRYWTQRSFAFALDVRRTSSGTSVSAARILPVRTGVQPTFLPEGTESSSILERIRILSPQLAFETPHTLF